MTNPFADCGTVVTADRFIGRADELRQIDARLFGDGAFGSLSVTGLPRIGKSSLLAEALRRASPKVPGLRAVVVQEDVGAFRSVDELFRCIIRGFQDEIGQSGFAGERWESINTCARKALDGPVTFENLRAVFRRIRQAGVRAICILDEFDAGRYLFTGAHQCFHWLRELASNPEFKAALVLVSKRRLHDVSRLAGHESNYWANVLMSIKLKPFSEADCHEFRRRLETAGVIIDEKTDREVTSVCGGHPFLLDAYAYQAWERNSRGESLQTSWLRESMRDVVRDYFDQLSTILRDGPMMGKLIQVVAGPQWDVGPHDVEALVDYGVLVEDGRRVDPFSEGFGEYIRLVEQSVEIWPLWRDTERALRDALETLLRSAFGESWPSELKKARPRLIKLIEACEDKLNREQARFGARAVSGLLAYAYPLDLYQLMSADWPRLGEPVLGGDRQGWAVKFTLLSKVRTPLAHNRDEGVDSAERIQAEGICREILQRCRKWKSLAE